MNKYKLQICSVLLLLAAGPAFGADLYIAGSVSVAMNVGGASVHDALQVSDRVLGAVGFVRGHTSSVNTLTPDNITVYTRDSSLGNPTACDVSLVNKRVVFTFVDNVGLPQHSGSATVQLSGQLANTLRQRYNGASVEVQLR